jgi:hypothetical protein
MRNTIVSTCILVMLTIVSPGAANATCGEECDGQYASEIDDCHSQYGDDPRCRRLDQLYPGSERRLSELSGRLRFGSDFRAAMAEINRA